MNKITLMTKDIEMSKTMNTYSVDFDQNMYGATIELNFNPALVYSNKDVVKLVNTICVTRMARIINSNLIEMDEEFTSSVEISKIYNIDNKELYDYISDMTYHTLKKFIFQQKGGRMIVKGNEPLNLYLEDCPELDKPSLLRVSQEEEEYYERKYIRKRVETIKAHFNKVLSNLYPNGFTLDPDCSNEKEYNYYSCLLNFVNNVENFTDTMNLSAKYKVELYKHSFSQYKTLEHLCSKFNALLLNILIIRKYDGKYGLLKSQTKLTGKTLEYYMIGYISAYNKSTITRINRSLGGNYLIMV